MLAFPSRIPKCSQQQPSPLSQCTSNNHYYCNCKFFAKHMLALFPNFFWLITIASRAARRSVVQVLPCPSAGARKTIRYTFELV